uniref:Peroxidase n=1 Tax=Kalanchoe fedtschenkoi TaxID=63787 RepID=A0A7N0T1U6_KALFE
MSEIRTLVPHRTSVVMASKLSVCFLALLFTSAHLAFCKLDPNYYSKTCPQLHHIVATGLKTALKSDPRIAASLLRLHYTDCFVNGCEASVLLDDAKGVKGEKNAVQNRNSLRGFEVIDHIKAKVEKACPSTVSCADILTLAAKESIVASGGPSWTVPLGRRDGKAASEKAANEQLPAPSESIVAIYNKYRLINYNGTGKADPNMNPKLRADLQAACPNAAADSKLYPLDPGTPYNFDLSYYNNLLSNGGVLESDLYLMSDRLLASWVVGYSKDRERFFKDYAEAMVRMGNVGVITAPNGQVRKHCRVVN